MVHRKCRCHTRGLAWVIVPLLGGGDGRHTGRCRSSCWSWVPTGGDGTALHQDGGTEDGGTDEGENDGSGGSAGSGPVPDEYSEPSEIGIAEGRIGRTERPKDFEEESRQKGHE